jgi:hypothetical protein
MAVEANNHRCNLAIPESNTAILVPYSEEVGVRFALRNCCDRKSAFFIFPAAQKLAFLDIPAQNLFVRSSDSLPGTGAISFP